MMRGGGRRGGVCDMGMGVGMGVCVGVGVRVGVRVGMVGVWMCRCVDVWAC